VLNLSEKSEHLDLEGSMSVAEVGGILRELNLAAMHSEHEQFFLNSIFLEP
jgi:hypothetical protein